LPELGGDRVLYIPQYLSADDPRYGQSDEQVLRRYADALALINPAFDRSWIRYHAVFRDRFAQPICLTDYQETTPSIQTPMANLFLTDSSPPLALQLWAPPPPPSHDAAEALQLLSRVFGAPGDETGVTPGAFVLALLWLPFYGLGELWGRAGFEVASGGSTSQLRAVGFGSLAYGVGGLLLVARVLGSLVSRRAAWLGVLLLLYATFLYWYLVFEPITGVAPSFFLAATVLALWWDGRSGPGAWRTLALGLLVGLATTLHGPSAALLLLPAGALRPVWARAKRAWLTRAITLLAGFAFGTLPLWVTGVSVLGRDATASVDLGRPYLLEGLFSSRHGLLFWNPLLWAGVLGLLLLWRKPRGAPGNTLAATLLALGFLNVFAGSWWLSGRFPNHRFETALPLLGVGLGIFFDWLLGATARRPGRVLALGGAALMLWNFLFMELNRRTLIPRDDTVSFPRVAGLNAAILGEWVGSPVAWPANWIFAHQTGLPAAHYDRLVGQRLLLGPGSLGGVIDIGADLERDAALLAGQWSVRRPCGETRCRDVEGRALVLAPLSRPRDLELTVHARGTGELKLSVNGFPVAILPLDESLAALRVRVPEPRWRRGPNEIAFEAARSGTIQVDRLEFRPLGR